MCLPVEASIAKNPCGFPELMAYRTWLFELESISVATSLTTEVPSGLFSGTDG